MVMKEVLIDGTNMHKYFRQTKEYIFVNSIRVHPGESAEGEGNITEDEWYFKYHFPGNPMMPGVFQMEAIMQTAGVIINTLTGKEEHRIYFESADNVKISGSVLPGDKIETYVKVISNRRGLWKFQGIALVDGNRKCKMDFTLIDSDDVKTLMKGR